MISDPQAIYAKIISICLQQQGVTITQSQPRKDIRLPDILRVPPFVEDSCKQTPHPYY